MGIFDTPDRCVERITQMNASSPQAGPLRFYFGHHISACYSMELFSKKVLPQL